MHIIIDYFNFEFIKKSSEKDYYFERYDFYSSLAIFLELFRIYIEFT